MADTLPVPCNPPRDPPLMYRTVPIDQLRPGMYVQRVNGAWLKHPFWRTSFLASEREIERLRDSGIQSVDIRSEEHTSELQSREKLVCRLLLEKKKKRKDRS